MSNTYHQVYIQAVFAVKYREAIITSDCKSKILSVIGNLINETGCKTLIVNGTEDHVHCLLSLKPTISISELMKIVKGKSSKFINDHQLTKHKFEWQEGYGAFSYSKFHIDAVYKYIANQEEHHKRENFKDEYISLLNKFNVKFDEKYIFEKLL
ncbi:transposase [Flavobacterium aquidurense]|uniref:IS200/IS605 family transposase n=1 Tax=Flavobacterium aquidurense TaxID=362413 RepID=UPI00091480B6|nr:IS200/IS605 family transposase [Flavobacterium aquidurense]OXA72426.1 transposase [Flavobacterium aquidurense]SHG41531.1 REP element-mobilizing transposase RayT [Flavobacterium frigidimaris]